MAHVAPFCKERQKVLDADLEKFVETSLQADFSDYNTIRIVRAVNYKNEPMCIVKWLNAYRRRKLFPTLSRPLKPSLSTPWILPTNHELWLEVSTYLIDIFHHIMSDKDLHPSMHLKYLIFRDKNDFYAGSWNAFKQFWLPFIQEYDDPVLKDNIYSTLHYGVDTLSFSRQFTEDNPTRFRITSNFTI